MDYSAAYLTVASPRTRSARRWLWLSLMILLVGVIVGGTWDKLWHATYPFDGFWSPPHLVIYVACVIVTLLVMLMTALPRVRAAFGQDFAIPFARFRVPGALVLLGGGLAITGFAGIVLDNIWHSSFGLDETSLSFPHAMIGWGLMVITLGYVSAIMALNRNRPMRWYTALLIGTLVLLSSATPLAEPFIGNRTSATLSAINNIPVLAAQPPVQHAYRIAETWDLMRTNPLFILVAALWTGAAFAFLRRLDRRWWVFLGTVLLWQLMDNAKDTIDWADRMYPGLHLSATPANFEALQIFLPAVLLLILLKLRLPELWAWSASGVLLGLLTCVIWSRDVPGAWLLVWVAGLVMLGGKALGERAYLIISQPTTFRRVAPLLMLALLWPLTTGIVDLSLRAVTP